ncbi:MAG: phosphate ABC transporter permease PstA [bacterium]
MKTKIEDISQSKYKMKSLSYRLFKDRLFKILVITISTLATIPLIFILYYITKMGFSSISWEFFINLPKPPGEVGGGISNALVGTLILILLSSIISIPPAIGLGIYMSENSTKKISKWIGSGVEILQGIPSIVIGIIAYVWVVRPTGGFSAISGAVALAMMMIPFVAKSTEETLKMIPLSLKESSMALGVPYYKTILKVVLPAGLSGIITGILIAVARVAGETAPLLFTAFGNHFMTVDVTGPMNSLPLLIFNYAGSPYEEWHTLAWGASFVLVFMVLLLNIISKFIAKRWKVKF